MGRGGQLTARMDEVVLKRLDRLSRREGVSRSRIAERLIDEGTRMDEFPGVVFRPGPAGRRAALATGPDVWEIVRDLKAAASAGREPISATAEATDLPEAKVKLAADYYASYPEEIDERLTVEAEAAERLRELLGVSEGA